MTHSESCVSIVQLIAVTMPVQANIPNPLVVPTNKTLRCIELSTNKKVYNME